MIDFARAALVLGAGAAGGLLVGPYVNYAVVRWVGWRVTLPLLLGFVPSRAGVGAPPIRCRDCGAGLSGRLGPVLAWSWVWRRGRCGTCGERVASRVVVVEVATAVVFAVATWRVGLSWALPPVLALCGGLVAASVVDLAYWRIPTRFVYLTGLLVGGLLVLAALAGGEPGSIIGALVGAFSYFGLLAVMHLASPRLLGFGDVRLGLLIGMVVGWMTWTPDLPVLAPLGGVLQALLLASIAGTLVGLGLWVVRRRSEPYPFGPWLSLGGLASILIAAPGAF